MFETLEGKNRRRDAGRLLALLFSISIHGLLVLFLVILPLLFIHALPGVELLTFLIAAPAPPPAPPPPAPPPPQAQTPAARQFVGVREFPIGPVSIPKGIPPPDNEPGAVIAPSALSGIPASILGGAGLNSGTLLGSVLQSSQPPAPLPAPPRPAPMKIGGSVQDAKLIHKVLPEYPRIALQARVSGTVSLEVQVDEEGNVTSVKVLGGHPLLVEEAVRVVKLWKYSPTLLNNEPIPVISTVHVIFSMK